MKIYSFYEILLEGLMTGSGTFVIRRKEHPNDNKIMDYAGLSTWYDENKNNLSSYNVYKVFGSGNEKLITNWNKFFNSTGVDEGYESHPGEVYLNGGHIETPHDKRKSDIKEQPKPKSKFRQLLDLNFGKIT